MANWTCAFISVPFLKWQRLKQTNKQTIHKDTKNEETVDKRGNIILEDKKWIEEW